MPYRILPTKNGKWKVVSPNGIHAKGTILDKAKSQVRLLNAIEKNPDFKPYKKK
jgi:hypothetical protein